MNITSGVPPFLIPDTYDNEQYRNEALAALPHVVRFQRELIQLHAQANIDIEKEALSKLPVTRGRHLNSIIERILVKFDELGASCLSKLGKFPMYLRRNKA